MPVTGVFTPETFTSPFFFSQLEHASFTVLLNGFLYYRKNTY